MFTEPEKLRLKAAEGWLELGDWLAANEELEEIDAGKRGAAPVLVLRCRIYAAAGKWEVARDIGRLVGETRSADAEMLLALARSCCALGDNLEGRRWLTAAVNLNQTPEFKLRVLDDARLKGALTA